ncbi:MAG: hypothetical protein IJN77_01685 [Oscillospiraceae bacterium]|nr:hypothetical protein [Oscillospiraceae bacterium]
MSIKSILNGKSDIDREFQSIVKSIMPTKELFETMSGERAFSKYPIKVFSENADGNYASLVGIAFDYLARAIIAHVLTGAKEKSTVGYKAIYGIKHWCRYLNEEDYELLLNYSIDVLSDFIDYIYHCPPAPDVDLLNEVCNDLEWTAWCRFVKNADSENHKVVSCIEDLINGAIFFAKMEQIYRSGCLPSENVCDLLSTSNDDMFDDLKKLCKVFVETFIDSGIVTEDSVVVFNPSFGISSFACGGADADIYIDGTLYDFKTSKTSGYKGQEIAQITSYWLLDIVANSIEGVNEPSDLSEFRVDNIALYKARFGQIEYCPIELITDEYFDEKLHSFGKHILDRLTIIFADEE